MTPFFLLLFRGEVQLNEDRGNEGLRRLSTLEERLVIAGDNCLQHDCMILVQ